MVSKIAENSHEQFISIQHIGFLVNGIEDTTSEAVKSWGESFENYTLTPTSTGTLFQVDMDAEENYTDYFNQVWPKALIKLKQLSETGKTTEVTIGVTLTAPIEKIWDFWTNPTHITKWNQASPDWETTTATNNLKVGGKFSYHMSAKDKSAAFNFSGTYTEIIPNKLIKYTLDDNRKVIIEFNFLDSQQTSIIRQTFELETQNPANLQRQGWQAIMNNFKLYTESN